MCTKRLVQECNAKKNEILGKTRSILSCNSWSSWTPASQCTAICGTGRVTFKRKCRNEGYGPYAHVDVDSSLCTPDSNSNSDEKSESCNENPCPTHGNWESWGACASG